MHWFHWRLHQPPCLLVLCFPTPSSWPPGHGHGYAPLRIKEVTEPIGPGPMWHPLKAQMGWPSMAMAIYIYIYIYVIYTYCECSEDHLRGQPPQQLHDCIIAPWWHMAWSKQGLPFRDPHHQAIALPHGHADAHAHAQAQAQAPAMPPTGQAPKRNTASWCPKARTPLYHMQACMHACMHAWVARVALCPTLVNPAA